MSPAHRPGPQLQVHAPARWAVTAILLWQSVFRPDQAEPCSVVVCYISVLCFSYIYQVENKYNSYIHRISCYIRDTASDIYQISCYIRYS
jgi:hypothetical protein